MMKKRLRWMLSAMLACCGVTVGLTACSSDDAPQAPNAPDIPTPTTTEKVSTVAVVAPIGDPAVKARLERTAQWFQDSFREAQQGDTTQFFLKLEWHDELTEDPTTLSRLLGSREDILAVIGPFANENVARFAPACLKTHKPLIAPTASSEEVVRRYAVSSMYGMQYESAFLWTLTETDMRCVETMMSLYRTWLGKLPQEQDLQPNVAVFSPANQYGQTFFDWAPFHAQSLDVHLSRNEQYADSDDLLNHLNNYLQHQKQNEEFGNALISSNLCVVETTRQLCDVARLRRKSLIQDYQLASVEKDKSTSWDDSSFDQYWDTFEGFYRTWFAFGNLSDEAIATLDARDKAMLQGYQGFSPYADPATGFEQAYTEKFGTAPTFAECKFFDALLLAGLGSCLMQTIKDKKYYFEDVERLSNNALFNFCIYIMGIDAEKDSEPGDALWRATAMRDYIQGMRVSERLKHFCGASGHIIFDTETCTQVARTTYVHWQLMDGRIYHRTYFGPNGKLVVSPSAAWNVVYDEDTADKEFGEMAEYIVGSMSYPALTDQYAVLVQGSEGTINYRHMADVLSVYQLLRKGGFDDDHIILILDKQEAERQGNVIRSSYYSKDLMGGTDGLPPAVVDYDNHALTAADISNILRNCTATGRGNLPARTRRQADESTSQQADESTNVLFYWSGHGRSQSNGGIDEFEWLGTPGGQGFTADLLRQTASEMLTDGGCRKLLVIAEPCYAEATVSGLKGIVGALAIVGASATEQSWGDNWNNESLYWMSDRFTKNVVEELTANPSVTYRNLFIYCAQHTLGSHAKIVNASHFGNLYTDGPKEFIIYNK